jgi:hypothetical protein
LLRGSRGANPYRVSLYPTLSLSLSLTPYTPPPRGNRGDYLTQGRVHCTRMVGIKSKSLRRERKKKEKKRKGGPGVKKGYSETY